MKGKYWFTLLAVLLAFMVGIAAGRGSLMLQDTVLHSDGNGISSSDITISRPQIHGPEHARLDLNTATAAALQELPGVGEVMAQSILSLRQNLGSFTAVSQLLEVEGLGQGIYDRIKNLVYVGEN